MPALEAPRAHAWARGARAVTARLPSGARPAPGRAPLSAPRAPATPPSGARRKLDEKKNVWIALLNLEKAHGTAESLAGAFKRACADQNAKHMYLQMATVHERAGDGEAVSQTFDAACKHYKASKKVWLAKMDWQMRAAKPEAAKATLERALQSLARRKHVATIVKFAQLEYRHGARLRACLHALLQCRRAPQRELEPPSALTAARGNS